MSLNMIESIKNYYKEPIQEFVNENKYLEKWNIKTYYYLRQTEIIKDFEF